MADVTLIILVFKGVILFQAWEPDNRFDNMDSCKAAAEEYLKIPPAQGGVPQAICIDPKAGQIYYGSLGHSST